MLVPIVNLRPALEAARDGCQARLDELFARMQFILGEQVALFEQEFAARVGASHAVGVGNGTQAIELCLREAGAAAHSGQAITSALTAPFTGVAILGAGCRPRFADIDPETLQIDADDCGNRLTKKTAVLVPVHLYGQPCALDRFAALARERRLTLVQDACQAHGARFRGRPLTSYSRLVAYSFYPTKNLGCLGDGGAVVTNRATAARRLRMLRDGGRASGQVSRIAGINSRLDEMQACYLRAFLPRLEEWNADRARTAALYDQGLADCSGVRLPRRTSDSVHHLYVIRAARREGLREFLARHGVGTAVHYPVPLHLHPAFADCGQRRGDLPHAEKACREIVSLPIWPYLHADHAQFVIARIRAFYSGKP